MERKKRKKSNTSWQENGPQSKQKPLVTWKVEINLVIVLLTFLALVTRLWNLGTPREIVFDEVHFGQFTALYLKRTFFFDVHPPLGKLLFTAVGYFAGFDENFVFAKIGAEYPVNVPVWHLRALSALFGTFLCPVVYQIIAELGFSHWSAMLAGFLVLFDNAILVQSRFILLDSMLLFFSMMSILSLLKFRNLKNRSFSFYWFIWLTLTGITMVCAISVKYNAIFTACIIFTIIGMDYWELIGNKNLSVINLLQHLVSYIGLLLLVPSLIYIGVFYVHLSILNQSGPHDDIMTSAFQATLQGGLSSITKGQPLEVSYGSQVTLRNTHGQNCWLHSHMYIYPIKYTDERGSSAQQQVTCYPFKDVNNWWIIKNPGRSSLTVDNPPKAVKHGDVIQLLHGTSGRALNSHDVAAPLSPHYMEVSCYIDYNISHPAQNLWKLEIANRDTEGDSWKSIQSRIRLVHMNTSQALKVTGRQLPDWGFHQFEVATDRILAQEGNIWNVEEHKYTRLPDQTELNFQDNSDVVSKLTFWEKLWEIQWKMLFATNDVTQEHQYSSEPNEWPFMEQGIAYWIDHNTNAQIYFLGNPIIWWMSSVGIIVYIILMVVAFIRRIRQCQDLDEESWERFVTSGVLFLGGWIINYLPFYLLERTLFLHHYLPALLFKIMLFPVAVELFSRYILRSGSQRQLFTWFLVPCCAQIVVTFVKFSPFSYGNRSVSSEEMEDCRWLDSWEFLQHGKLPY